MNKEFRRFFNAAVESFVSENLDGDNKELITELQEYSVVLVDDIVEYVDGEIFKIINNNYGIEI